MTRDLGTGQILIGDCRETLAGLPAGSVHVCVTSPPYWGLRVYQDGDEPVAPGVWGGAEGCEHQWGEEAIAKVPSSIRTRRNLAQAANACDGGTRRAEDRADFVPLQVPVSQGTTCLLCGAWRGSLGAEPLHDCLAWARGEDPCPTCYVCHLRTVARELWRVLRDDGTFWLNLGDSLASGKGTCHNPGGGENSLGLERKAAGAHPLDRGNKSALERMGLKPTDLCGIPQRVALALQADGWYWRSDVIWAKPNPQPESVASRPAKSHEHVLMLTKRAGGGAYFDMEAVKERGASGTSDLNKMAEQREREGGKAKTLEDPMVAASSATNIGHKRGVGEAGWRHLRDVWTIPTRGTRLAHFATMPLELAAQCIRASTSERGVCPECGAPWRRWTGRACLSCGEDVPTQGKSCPSCGHVNDWRKGREEHPQFGETDWSTPGRGTPRKDGSMGSSKTQTGQWQPTCTCGSPGMDPDDWQIIETPTGERVGEDPSLETGRAGMNRPRGDNEGHRPITRYEQRQYAEQLRASPHHDAMREEAGAAFDHYARTDRSGARPVPEDLLEAWLERGWLHPVTVPEQTPLPPIPATILDPFFGAGTTGLAAQKLCRRFVGIEISEQYAEMAALRIRAGGNEPLMADFDAADRGGQGRLGV